MLKLLFISFGLLLFLFISFSFSFDLFFGDKENILFFSFDFSFNCFFISELFLSILDFGSDRFLSKNNSEDEDNVNYNGSGATGYNAVAIAVDSNPLKTFISLCP